MKKMFIPFFFLLLCVACSENPSYKISGTVNDSDLEGKYVYLYPHALTDTLAIDSIQVENGKFQFTGKQDTPILAAIRFNAEDRKPERAPAGENAPFSAIFVLENGNIQVTLDTESYVTGTPENNDLAAFQKQATESRKEIMAIYKDAQSEDVETAQAARDKYDQISSANEKRVKDYISAHNNSLTGGKLLYDYRHSLDEDARRAIIDRADGTFVEAPGVSYVMDHLATLDKVAIGQKFTDFEMEDINGNMRSLSDYIGDGKWTLVDFWASWCGPCRREMPHVVDAYKQYKNKGFEIVGVSLDSSKDAWEKGVKELGITWPQLSDLEGWKNKGAALYGVNSIPHMLLINPEGTIMYKRFNAEELKEHLQEIFK